MFYHLRLVEMKFHSERSCFSFSSSESESHTDTVLVLDGETGNFWVKQTVTSYLLPMEQPFQLIIEGKVGEEELGDIAIDDLIFSSDCR